jgi:arylformamidase
VSLSSSPASLPPARGRLIDISRPLYTGAPHWPGDSATDYSLATRMAAGAACNIGRLSLSVHNGTHVDAPFHYNDAGAAIDALAPELFVGPARVIDARGHAAFTEALFAGLTAADFTAAPRMLFRTDTWTDLTTFPTTWPLLERTLPAWLAARGVKLIGLDVPSVDELTNKDMAIHHLLDAANILILESLDLRGVEAGVYELIALPLKLRGADGSPVRAVLRA